MRSDDELRSPGLCVVPVACPGPRSSLAHRQDAHLSRPSASQLERSRARCRPWRAPGSLRRRQSVSSPACQSHDPSGARGREAGGMTDPLIRQRIHPAFRGHTERLLGPLPASPLLLCSAGWRAHWPSRRRWTGKRQLTNTRGPSWKPLRHLFPLRIWNRGRARAAGWKLASGSGPGGREPRAGLGSSSDLPSDPTHQTSGAKRRTWPPEAAPGHLPNSSMPRSTRDPLWVLPAREQTKSPEDPCERIPPGPKSGLVRVASFSEGETHSWSRKEMRTPNETSPSAPWKGQRGRP